MVLMVLEFRDNQGIEEIRAILLLLFEQILREQDYRYSHIPQIRPRHLRRVRVSLLGAI
jgi:hypothetical protein